MNHMDVEAEIDVLESLLSNLESARLDALETSYHQYLASTIELDMEEIKSRLEELYDIQDGQWTKERQEQNREYEGSRL